jgi:hypothetical protein
MADYAPVTYTASGSTDNFTIPWPYINADYVNVYCNGILQTGYTFPTTDSVKLTSKPAAGVTVVISRVTPTDEKINTYSDTATITDEELNNGQDQLLQAFQEQKYSFQNTITLNEADEYDFGGHKIYDIAAPTQNSDGATKLYVDSKFAADISLVKEYRDTALSYANAANGYKNETISNASDAESYKNQAITNATNAGTYRDQAAASAASVNTASIIHTTGSGLPNAVSATVVSNGVPCRDTNGKLAGDITGNAATATNVTTNINGHAISSIFESNGVTVKVATDVLLPNCKIYSSSASIGVADGIHSIVFNATQRGTSGMHSNTTNPERVNILTSGVYLVTGRIQWASAISANYNYPSLYLYHHDVSASTTTLIAQAVKISVEIYETQSVTSTIYMETGDYVYLSARQETGATKIIYGTSSATSCLEVVKLSNL